MPPPVPRGGDGCRPRQGRETERKRHVAAGCSAAGRALLPAHRSRGGARPSLRGRSGDDHATGGGLLHGSAPPTATKLEERWVARI